MCLFFCVCVFLLYICVDVNCSFQQTDRKNRHDCEYRGTLCFKKKILLQCNWARSVICYQGTGCLGPPKPDFLPKAMWWRHLYVLLKSHNWWRYNYLNVSKQCWFSWKQRTRFTQCYSRTVRPTTKTKAKVLYNIILFVREITLYQWPPRLYPSILPGTGWTAITTAVGPEWGLSIVLRLTSAITTPSCLVCMESIF